MTDLPCRTHGLLTRGRCADLLPAAARSLHGRKRRALIHEATRQQPDGLSACSTVFFPLPGSP
jgi:hypothetical protein